MKLSPRQAEAINEAISFYLDAHPDPGYGSILMGIAEDQTFKTLVAQAPPPTGHGKQTH